MNLVKAAHNMELVVQAGLKAATGSETDVNAAMTRLRNTEGKGLEHALWMLNEIIEGKVSHEKGHRWLGYAQGLLVADGRASLESCKYANLLS